MRQGRDAEWSFGVAGESECREEGAVSSNASEVGMDEGAEKRVKKQDTICWHASGIPAAGLLAVSSIKAECSPYITKLASE